MATDNIQKLNQQFGKASRIKDADQDGNLLDDILRSKNTEEKKLQLAAKYLARLGTLANVTANGDPAHPEQMTWKIDGQDAFQLIKGDQFLKYAEVQGAAKDEARITTNGYGRLFSMHPWLLKIDSKAGVKNPENLRDPEYWIKKYARAANKPILDREGVTLFNAVDSKKDDKLIAKLDVNLDELPKKMTFEAVRKLIVNAYTLGSNADLMAADPCNLGASGKIFTGTLSDKTQEWTMRDWEITASHFGFPIRVIDMANKTCVKKDSAPQEIKQGYAFDFSQAGDPKQEFEIGYGIITNQTDLRAIPSEKSCYNNSGPGSDDDCQYHRPHIEAVRILWEGNGWSFVKTQQEYGWVKNEHLVKATKVDVYQIIHGEVAVTDFSFEKGETRYGLGTRLPFVRKDSENIVVKVPTRNKDGNLVWEERSLPASRVEVIPSYTYANVTRGFFEGAEAVWLLANKVHKGEEGDVEGLDCSGIIKAVLETFGLLLARNSAAQGLAGTKLWARPEELKDKASPKPENSEATWKENATSMLESRRQIDQVLKQWDKDMKAGKVRGPLILGWPGHVAGFLGFDDKGRAMVFSSLSRTKKIADNNKETAPWKATTDDVWALGPTVTPFDMGTDPVADIEIDRGGARPINWYNRITFIEELVPGKETPAEEKKED